MKRLRMDVRRIDGHLTVIGKRKSLELLCQMAESPKRDNLFTFLPRFLDLYLLLWP